MQPLRVRLIVSTLLLGGVLFGCKDITDPQDGVTESELTFVRMAQDAPPLSEDSISFWAVRGEDRMVEIRYLSNRYGNGKCLFFRVPKDALFRYPNGKLFAPGDSVRITIRVVDRTRFQYRFEPSGLKFDDQHPAELEVRFKWADPDYNGDGVVDSRDDRAAEAIRFWHQALPGGKWSAIPTQRTSDGFEAQADVFRFSQYALAID